MTEPDLFMKYKGKLCSFKISNEPRLPLSTKGVVVLVTDSHLEIKTFNRSYTVAKCAILEIHEVQPQ